MSSSSGSSSGSSSNDKGEKLLSTPETKDHKKKETPVEEKRERKSVKTKRLEEAKPTQALVKKKSKIKTSGADILAPKRKSTPKPCSKELRDPELAEQDAMGEDEKEVLMDRPLTEFEADMIRHDEEYEEWKRRHEIQEEKNLQALLEENKRMRDELAALKGPRLGTIKPSTEITLPPREPLVFSETRSGSRPIGPVEPGSPESRREGKKADHKALEALGTSVDLDDDESRRRFVRNLRGMIEDGIEDTTENFNILKRAIRKNGAVIKLEKASLTGMIEWFATTFNTDECERRLLEWENFTLEPGMQMGTFFFKFEDHCTAHGIPKHNWLERLWVKTRHCGEVHSEVAVLRQQRQSYEAVKAFLGKKFPQIANKD